MENLRCRLYLNINLRIPYVGVRTLIDIFSINMNFTHTLFHLPIFKYTGVYIYCLVDSICRCSCICVILLLCFNPVIVTFLLFLPASITYRLLCGQGLIMVCIRRVFWTSRSLYNRFPRDEIINSLHSELSLLTNASVW